MSGGFPSSLEFFGRNLRPVSFRSAWFGVRDIIFDSDSNGFYRFACFWLDWDDSFQLVRSLPAPLTTLLFDFRSTAIPFLQRLFDYACSDWIYAAKNFAEGYRREG